MSSGKIKEVLENENTAHSVIQTLVSAGRTAPPIGQFHDQSISFKNLWFESLVWFNGLKFRICLSFKYKF